MKYICTCGQTFTNDADAIDHSQTEARKLQIVQHRIKKVKYA